MIRCFRRSVLLGILSLSACDPELVEEELEEDETLGGPSLELRSDNALSPNALSPNALTPNALSPNALTPGALAAIRDPTEAGALSRLLLRYTVTCALDEGQSFSFAWREPGTGPAAGAAELHVETYRGQLGIAPSWAWEPLDESGQRMISACLAAHVNYFGVSVLISVRSPHPSLATPEKKELRDFAKVEGAFWGTLFGPTPRLYACYDKGHVGHVRRRRRICAAGMKSRDSDDDERALKACDEVQILGPCNDHCAKLDPKGKFYPACIDPETGVPTELVITTSLR